MFALARGICLVTVLWLSVVASEARVSKRVCKETCAGVVVRDCADLRKKKLKRCRSRILKQCRTEAIDCTAPTTTTTTTLPPGCPTTCSVGDPYTGGTGHTIAVADLNGDGKRDVIVGANPSVMIRLGNGDGTLGPIGGADAGGDVRGVAIADVSGDG